MSHGRGKQNVLLVVIAEQFSAMDILKFPVYMEAEDTLNA